MVSPLTRPPTNGGPEAHRSKFCLHAQATSGGMHIVARRMARCSIVSILNHCFCSLRVLGHAGRTGPKLRPSEHGLLQRASTGRWMKLSSLLRARLRGGAQASCFHCGERTCAMYGRSLRPPVRVTFQLLASVLSTALIRTALSRHRRLGFRHIRKHGAACEHGSGQDRRVSAHVAARIAKMKTAHATYHLFRKPPAAELASRQKVERLAIARREIPGIRNDARFGASPAAMARDADMEAATLGAFAAALPRSRCHLFPEICRQGRPAHDGMHSKTTMAEPTDTT